MRRLILRSHQSPGDILMLTAAVRDLHAAHPGQFQTDVRTSTDDLWVNNPHLTPLQDDGPNVETMEMHYPLIHQCNQRPYHFIHGYAQFLEERLGVRVPVSRFRGDVHLTEDEKQQPLPNPEPRIKERFWIIVAGGKYDFTAKWWNPESYQKVVDHFQGRIQFVQCGEASHWHPPLTGVVNLIGQTSTREFVRLMHHADGVVCPVTFAMHLAAAVETKPDRPKNRACVVIAGGREPPHWEAYPHHQFLSTNGALSCCSDGGCWKSRCQKVGDGDSKDRSNLCEQPVELTSDLCIPKCMDMISPADVIRRIELYYQGGAIPFSDDRSQRQKSPAISRPPPETAGTPAMNAPATEERAAAQPATQRNNGVKEVDPGKAEKQLLVFKHGLGDAVQLTAVIRHLRKFRPNWQIDVAAFTGKHSLFEGIADNVFNIDRGGFDRSEYTHVFDLEWPECATCYPNCPSTKVERCLQEVFQIAPVPDLCQYEMRIQARALALARTWIEKDCRVSPGSDGRYPLVLIHYQGNTSRGEKDLPTETVRRLCNEIINGGHVPVILDWDARSPLPDGRTIHNPHVDLEMWGGIGTGDAQILAALIEQSTLLIGVDSGPLHVAAATTTPTIGVWTGHHPLHYCSHSGHITHLVPHDHVSRFRGDREVGQKYFERHYRHCTYQNLEQSLISMVQERLNGSAGGLIQSCGYWIRTDNAQQDLVVVRDIAEEDSYHIDELDMPTQTVVDVGAHIGCFARRFHQRNPLARIIAVECCPENLSVLERNAGEAATIVSGAVTYEKNVALLNAVFPDCVTTGGSAVISRGKLEQLIEQGQYATSAQERRSGDYWADLRPIRTLTLEDIMSEHGLDRIDVLKLDCEGSEFSILEQTPSLDRIGIVIGEYHGRENFLDLVNRRFSDWELRILRDGELGTFWLRNPQQPQATLVASPVVAQAPPQATPPRATPASDVPASQPVAARPASTRPASISTTPILVAAMAASQPEGSYRLLLMNDGKTRYEYEHDRGWLRGFTRFSGRLWTIDSLGRLFIVHVKHQRVRLEEVASSPLAREAHDLSVSDGRLVTAGPVNNAIVLFDPISQQWSVRRPWISMLRPPVDAEGPDRADQHHLNSVLADGDGFILSLFSVAPKPDDQRWRESPLDQGVITRWGPQGFAEQPLATGVYAPHSLRRYSGHVWWCDSFRHTVCRDDGWVSPDLLGFTRGLSFADGRCIVGLSKSRVPPYPEGLVCGVCTFDPRHPEDRTVHELSKPFIEIYDVFSLDESDFS
ncbi:MAG: FkbM family methyltransferase [Rhodopirellula sp.]|nr:FkbM family methyltransferase [Rhodopirellula sp.]